MADTSELLNNVWKQWATNAGIKRIYNYQHERRNQRFEDWLWDNGARVTQDNRKKYLRFNSEKQQMWFLLKYNGN